MNNKRGGVGAKILLVLILMIASAIGGAYGYRVLDGKMAVSDAKKDIESVKLSDYDTVEASSVQDLIDSTSTDLNTASTRKEVYEIMEDFNIEISKIQTKTQKELEEARRAAEEARNSNNNNNNNSNNNSNNYNNGVTDQYDDEYDSGTTNNGTTNNSEDTSSSSGSNAITNDDGTSGRSGILSGFFGSGDDN
jgi:hypothetical protein